MLLHNSPTKLGTTPQKDPERFYTQLNLSFCSHGEAGYPRGWTSPNTVEQHEIKVSNTYRGDVSPKGALTRYAPDLVAL